MTDFVNNLCIPASVESMTLTGNIAFWCLLPTWPFIKKLHVDSFILDGDHGCLLKNFPALEELLVNGFGICSCAGFRSHVYLSAYEALKADVLSTLGNSWTVQVTGECLIGYQAVPIGSSSCMMLVIKKNN
jgi:hypothetical protein